VRTIAHLAELRFGREDPRAVGALLRDLAELAPSLVAVSGDLTQRAAIRELARARDFLVRVPAPLLVVPGNRDVPLLDVLRRLARPLERYRAWITRDLEPVFADDELLVLGVSTARSLGWKGGRISWEQLERVQRLAGAAAPGRLRVLVAHHPFAPPVGLPHAPPPGWAEAALSTVAACGVDLVLTGRLHRGSREVEAPGHTVARGAIALHGGSALSSRRGEPASYELVRTRGARLEVELRAFTGSRFEPVGASRFTRVAAGWVPLAPIEAPAAGDDPRHA
jgi:hypothetical protein